jgi:hypothetical protein
MVMEPLPQSTIFPNECTCVIGFSVFEIFSINFSREKFTTGGSSFFPRQVAQDESFWQQAEQKVWPLAQNIFGLLSGLPDENGSKQTSQLKSEFYLNKTCLGRFQDCRRGKSKHPPWSE